MKLSKQNLIEAIYFSLILLIAGVPVLAVLTALISIEIIELIPKYKAKILISLISITITIALILGLGHGLIIYTAVYGYGFCVYTKFRGRNINYTERLLLWLASLYIFTVMEISSYNIGKVLDLLISQDGNKLLLIASIFIIKSLLDLISILFEFRYSALIIGNICNIISIINVFTMSFINKPFRLDEVKLAGTALNVVSNYTVNIDEIITIGSLILLIIMYNCIVIRVEYKKDRVNYIRVLMNIIPLVIIYTLWFGPNNIGTLDYMPLDSYGTVMHILNSVDKGIKEPDNYIEYKDSDFEETEQVEIDKKPNIIIIMNEAFSDLSVIKDIEGIDIKNDIIPYTSELMNNTQSGYLYSSVWGNNTVSSEIECLTGIPTGFVTSGAKIYSRYLNDNMPSIAKVLKEYGYTTYGVHPYDGTGYNRLNGWNALGIDNKLFIESFDSKSSKIRQYISDSENYQKLYNITENEDNPVFIFNVTMQNHGGYDNLEQSDINVANDRELSNYLYLLNKSDKALEEMITYYSNCDEDTIIVFFGDHQPSLTSFYDNSKNGINEYKVPYFIWSNYDNIELDIPEEISINYIPSIVLEAVDIKDKWFNGIYNIISDYPIISENVYKYKNNDKIIASDWTNQIDNLTSEDIRTYKIYESLSYRYITEK